MRHYIVRIAFQLRGEAMNPKREITSEDIADPKLEKRMVDTHIILPDPAYEAEVREYTVRKKLAYGGRVYLHGKPITSVDIANRRREEQLVSSGYLTPVVNMTETETEEDAATGTEGGAPKRRGRPKSKGG